MVTYSPLPPQDRQHLQQSPSCRDTGPDDPLNFNLTSAQIVTSSKNSAADAQSSESRVDDAGSTNAREPPEAPRRYHEQAPSPSLANEAIRSKSVHTGPDQQLMVQEEALEGTPRSSWESQGSFGGQYGPPGQENGESSEAWSSANTTNPFRRAQRAPANPSTSDHPDLFANQAGSLRGLTSMPSNGQTAPAISNTPHQIDGPNGAPLGEVDFGKPSNTWHQHAAKLGAKPLEACMGSANAVMGSNTEASDKFESGRSQDYPLPQITPNSKGELREYQPASQHPVSSNAAPSNSNSEDLLDLASTQSVDSPRTPSTEPTYATEGITSTHLSQSKYRDPKTETYQIRLVNWYDAVSPGHPRRSPIMVQNANGPCPLLALVNALILSTPSTTETPLVETLRVREQISLELLLSAVVDELMSGRRGDAAQNLPDIGDLHSFLVNLHTGMNVNPRFVASSDDISLMDIPIEQLPSANDLRKPGGFELTREMRLYGTFAIPLIHGWIPSGSHPAYKSLRRAAPTYEDAQNLMFKEEELEAKLRFSGLTMAEEIVLEDIGNIKYFLHTTGTQLTGYGLDTVTESLIPGSLAILFRNDHFSTLYRHPRSGQLLTLVTDMGYAGHDEVVWESLVDVSGEGSEFYSGDFRLVGNNTQDNGKRDGFEMGPETEETAGWTTVNGRSGRRATQRNKVNNHLADPSLPSLESLNLEDTQDTKSKTTEQEDHDLALAMQLQEEEEQHDRQEAARRRRDDEASQTYLNNADAQGRRTFPGFGRGAQAQNRPIVPPRGGSNAQRPGPRQIPVTQRRQSSSEDAPPPSYEQAAKGPAYHPPADHPAYSPGQSNTTPGPNTQRPLPQRPRGASAYSEHAGSYEGSPLAQGIPRRGRPMNGPVQGMGARRKTNETPLTAAAEEKKDKDCIIM